MTLKINRVPHSPKDFVHTKFSQNPLKFVYARVFRRMLCGKNLTLTLTLKFNSVHKDVTEGRTDGRKDGRTDDSINISLRNFVGEGIKIG